MKKLIKNPNFIIIAVVSVVAVILLAATSMSGRGGDYVRVSVDGVTVATYPLNVDNTYVLEGFDGGTNTLVIENGQAYMSDATCPDSLCVKTGHIHMAGQSIICLPNRVVVEVVKSSENSVDAISR